MSEKSFLSILGIAVKNGILVEIAQNEDYNAEYEIAFVNTENNLMWRTKAQTWEALVKRVEINYEHLFTSLIGDEFETFININTIPQKCGTRSVL